MIELNSVRSKTSEVQKRKDSLLPHSRESQSWLGFGESEVIESVWEECLLRPVRSFLERPSKKFRARLVELSAQTGGKLLGVAPSVESMHVCAEVLELIHAGSLIVDDIEDGSQVRRGLPTLHREVGLPIALNAGNWLYFWPMEKIRALRLQPETELRLYQLCHQGLIRAHFGQSMDLGVRIDHLEQTQVREVCLASLRLKTGALTEMAVGLGLAITGVSGAKFDKLVQFGEAFGVALQMLDDLSNLKLDPAKRYEDLVLKRPSWLWAFVASSLTPMEYSQFKDAVTRLPDDRELLQLLNREHRLQKAKQEAVEQIFVALENLEDFLNLDLGSGAEEHVALLLQPWRELGEKLSYAYL